MANIKEALSKIARPVVFATLLSQEPLAPKNEIFAEATFSRSDYPSSDIVIFLGPKDISASCIGGFSASYKDVLYGLYIRGITGLGNQQAYNQLFIFSDFPNGVYRGESEISCNPNGFGRGSIVHFEIEITD